MKCDMCGAQVTKAHEYSCLTNKKGIKIISYRCKCGRAPMKIKQVGGK